MMISRLRAAKTATFHQANCPLSKAAVYRLFMKIRRRHPSAGNNLFKDLRDPAGNKVCAAHRSR